MEEGLQSSPQFDDSIDNDDSKYLCGHSTILVANIQELKDRISQIEFIFCSQLFPNFQSRSKNLQKRLLEAKKTANDEWKKRENSLLHQIKELHLQKQCAQEEVQQLNMSIEETKKRLSNSEELVIKYEHEKIYFLTKVENLETNGEMIAKFKEQLGQMTDELAEGKKMQEKLLQQIEIKDHNLLAEQNKRKGLVEEFNKCKNSYKHLKAQYSFLLGKMSDSKDNKHHPDRMGEEKDSESPYLNKKSPQDSEHKDKEIDRITSWPVDMKAENDSLRKNLGSIRDIVSFKPTHEKNSHITPSSTSTSLPPKHIFVNTKSEPSIGMKRSASCWRDTRMRQEPGGADPHDDFLDTPMEIVRNLNMNPQEEVEDFNNSDDETQEVVNPDPIPPKQPISVIGPATNKGFKYVEPVRKKAERENLRGVECKQCKKFYDAVLPDGNTNDGFKSMRCEHHDGVSRHRYRYAPPLTPEGFWNIGFESEL